MTIEALLHIPQLPAHLRAGLEALPVGAVHVRCALQVNSYDYMKRHMPATAEEFDGETDYNTKMVASAIQNKVGVIALADHFRVDGAEGLREAFVDADIIVFPGFEAYSKDGIHLLCMFPPETSLSTLGSLIGMCGVTLEDDEASPQSDKDAEDIMAEVTKAQGIVVAPHVQAARGLLRELPAGKARSRVWRSENLSAAGIPKTAKEALQEYKSILLNKNPEYTRAQPLALLNCGDVSKPEDFADSSKTTWLKLAAHTTEGLRQAFLDHESRVRLNSEAEADVSPEIVAIAWEGGFLDEQCVVFNNGLNVLLGGRGAGKSSVIESIRYVLGTEIEAPDSKRNHNSIIEHITEGSGRVWAVVSTGGPDPTYYVIDRQPNEAVRVRRSDGTLVDASPASLVPDLEIYGQHELSALTEMPETLAKLLKRFATEPESSDKELLRALADNRMEICRLLDRKDDLEDETSDLGNINERVARMDAAGADKVFDELIKGDRDRDTLRGRVQQMNDAASMLGEYTLEVPTPSDLSASALVQADLASIQAIKRASESVAVARKQLSEGAGKIEEALKQFATERAASDAALKAKLGASDGFEINPSTYRALLKRKRSLENKQNELALLGDDLSALRSKRAELLSDLRDASFNRNRTVERNAKRASRTPGLKGVVKVEVEKGVDFDAFRSVIGSYDKSAAAPTLRKIKEAEDLSSSSFAAAIESGSAALQETYGISAATSDKLALAGERLAMEIQEITPRPRALVHLNIGTHTSPHWKQLDNLSKGQKATAVLLILLSGAAAPLVIDQPEDDLDNRFISSTVVTTIRKQKRLRQLIFATHNPNIPVLGDAELVSCLTATVDDGKEAAACADEHTGSIDVDSVRDMIGDLLEGGREAFDLRKRKYGF